MGHFKIYFSLAHHFLRPKGNMRPSTREIYHRGISRWPPPLLLLLLLLLLVESRFRIIIGVTNLLFCHALYRQDVQKLNYAASPLFPRRAAFLLLHQRSIRFSLCSVCKLIAVQDVNRSSDHGGDPPPPTNLERQQHRSKNPTRSR